MQRSILLKKKINSKDSNVTTNLDADEKRHMCIRSPLDAIQISSTSYNRQKSFEIFGIFPRSMHKASGRDEVRNRSQLSNKMKQRKEKEINDSILKEIVNHLIENAVQFREFFDEDESLEEYEERIRTDGEWGEGRLFGALAQLFDTRIDVHTPGQQVFSDGGQHPRTIRLGFVRQCHYVSI
ncbi:MAG: hypothetical protein EZS28_028815 [Streblomastix strix]|uniref:OTU domain-containing protein n=1 Tax=Streblomastix strix TaxID=222440 RepID=A0A5J4UYR2_9EUKA|nr:MAG: hypothetical protein EZS28_028815 [Streblomastix strix]